MSPARFLRWIAVPLLVLACFAGGLPKHAKLDVRLDQMLSSETSSTGETFAATLDRDVALVDKTVLKKGSAVRGIVRQVNSTFNDSRMGELDLELTSVVCDGKTYDLTTNPVWLSGDPGAGPNSGRAEAEQAAAGVLLPRQSQSIPGTNVAVGRQSSGRRVFLPAKSKLTFVVINSTYVKP